MSAIPERLFPITSVLDERKEHLIEQEHKFNFPYICEAPTVPKGLAKKFRRCIHIAIGTIILDELGFGREIEGKDAGGLYEIHIIAPDITDLRDIVKKIRFAWIHESSTYYRNIVASDILRIINNERGKIIVLMGVKGNTIGMDVDADA